MGKLRVGCPLYARFSSKVIRDEETKISGYVLEATVNNIGIARDSYKIATAEDNEKLIITESINSINYLSNGIGVGKAAFDSGLGKGALPTPIQLYIKNDIPYNFWSLQPYLGLHLVDVAIGDKAVVGAHQSLSHFIIEAGVTFSF